MFIQTGTNDPGSEHQPMVSKTRECLDLRKYLGILIGQRRIFLVRLGTMLAILKKVK